MEDDELRVYLKWTLHSIDLLYTWSVQSLLLFSKMHIRQTFWWILTMNLWTAKVCLRTLICKFLKEGHPNFLQNIFLCCWNDLLPFYHHYSFCAAFMVSSFYFIVVLYQFVIMCVEIWRVRSLKRKKRFKIRIMFLGHQQHSREDSLFLAFYIWSPGTGYREEANGFLKAELSSTVSGRSHVFADILP